MSLINFDRGTMMCIESSTRSLKTIADKLPTKEERDQQMLTTLVAAMLTKGYDLEAALGAAQRAFSEIKNIS